MGLSSATRSRGAPAIRTRLVAAGARLSGLASRRVALRLRPTRVREHGPDGALELFLTDRLGQRLVDERTHLADLRGVERCQQDDRKLASFRTACGSAV